jgi:DNA-binding IscR family transcriptional regulator
MMGKITLEAFGRISPQCLPTRGQVIRAVDGPLAPIRCASRTAFEACDDCRDPASCQIRISMTQVRDAMAAVLDTMTLTQFVASARTDQDLIAGE